MRYCPVCKCNLEPVEALEVKFLCSDNIYLKKYENIQLKSPLAYHILNKTFFLISHICLWLFFIVPDGYLAEFWRLEELAHSLSKREVCCVLNVILLTRLINISINIVKFQISLPHM